MFLILQMAVFWNIEKKYFMGWSAPVVKIAACVFIYCAAVVAFKNVSDVTRNLSFEYHFIQAKVRQCNPAATKRFVIVAAPPLESFIDRKLPFEFNALINSGLYAAPILLEELRHTAITRNIRIEVLLPEQFKGFLLKENDFLINFNEMITSATSGVEEVYD